MPRSESRTRTAIWSDDDFVALSERAQRLYWFLYSQPTINLTGILPMTLKRWASKASDSTEEGLTQTLAELENHNFVVVDFQTEELWIRSFARHDGVGNSPKTRIAAWGQLDHIFSRKLRPLAEAALRDMGIPNDGPQPPKKPVDTLSHTLSDGVSHTLSDTPSDTLRTRGRADSSLRPQPPSPDTSLPSPEGTGDLVLRTEEGDEGQQAMTPLQRRMHTACMPRSYVACAFEAVAVTRWALDHVSEQIVDEAIGWALAKKGSDDPVRLPRAIARVIREKAKDSGISMPEYDPQVYLRLVRSEAQAREAS